MLLKDYQIAFKLRSHNNLDQFDNYLIVKTFFLTIKESLINGGDVSISNFGKFTLNDKSERPGRNPKTGEEHMISARRVVNFKSSKKLKDLLNKPTAK